MISEKLKNSIRDYLDDGWTKTEIVSMLRSGAGFRSSALETVDECAAFIDSIADANERDIKAEARWILDEAPSRADHPSLTAEERNR